MPELQEKIDKLVEQVLKEMEEKYGKEYIDYMSKSSK